MEMKDAAFNLFIQESFILSLKEDSDLSGSLASALQKRHKVRKVDLERLFKLADEATVDIEKAYYVYTLILYSGAAYKNGNDLWNVHNQQPLGTRFVYPHWDAAATYSLQSVYLQEPMNLFPGWSLTNQKNNNTTLDLHWFLFNPTNKLEWATDLVGTAVHSKTVTQGMETATALHYVEGKIGQHRLNGQISPGRQRSLTPYSINLDQNQLRMQKTLHKLSGPSLKTPDMHKKAYDWKGAQSKFEKLRTEMINNTNAGIIHYDNLVRYWKLIKGDTAISDVLVDAQMKWDAHRGNIKMELDNIISQITSRQIDMSLYQRS